ncbi:MAG: glycosyltransferase family 4 protein [Bacteroidota bacterium]
MYINSIVIIDYILATRFAKTKAFIHIHELPQGYASKIFSKLLSFSGAHLIFISSASKNAFIHLKNAKQSIVWNGVKPLQQSKPIAEALNKIKLLLIGRINSWKGQPLLIEAIALLSDTEKNIIEVQIVGDVFMDQQQLKTELTEQIFKNNLQDKIKISPFTTSPEVFYNWADVVIVPSLLPEPFGLVAIEAMSLGKLVIAAGHGGLKEIITHNVSGMLFKPGDANDLSHKIKEVIQNPSLITVLGENGRRKFETNFTEEIYIKKINELI